MNERNFAYWLQGFFELTDSNNLTEEQVIMIKEHLQLVFNKSTSNTNYLIKSALTHDERISDVLESDSSNAPHIEPTISC